MLIETNVDFYEIWSKVFSAVEVVLIHCTSIHLTGYDVAYVARCEAASSFFTKDGGIRAPIKYCQIKATFSFALHLVCNHIWDGK